MLTRRGRWLLLLALFLLLAGFLRPSFSLSLTGTLFLSWFLLQWGFFLFQIYFLPRSWRYRRILRDAQGPVRHLWVGGNYTVHLELASSHFWSSLHIYIKDLLPYLLDQTGGQNYTAGTLAAGRSLTVEYTFTCPVPGVLRFEGLAVGVSDVQGFFYHYLFLRQPLEVLVLPYPPQGRSALLPVKRHNVLPLLGSHRHRRPGTGSELLDLRDYRPGDPPRTIAWKISARRQQLITKEFESEVPVRCTLFVDAGASVRLGNPRHCSLTQLVLIAAGVLQATLASRDPIGLCLVEDEQVSDYVRPARGQRHLLQLLALLARAAGQLPRSARPSLDRLLPLAWSLACQVYPDWLWERINAFPFWLPFWSPQPAYTLPGSAWRLRWLLTRPGRAWARLRRRLGRSLRQYLLARFSAQQFRRYYRRKKLAALLAVRYQLGAGALAHLLEDDDACAAMLQRFLAEHRIAYVPPLYDEAGHFLFTAPQKASLLAQALLYAVGRARDNELYVLLVDLWNLEDQLTPLLQALRVARARHHEVVVVCPWPADLPPPQRAAPAVGSHEPATPLPVFLRQLVHAHYQQVYQRLRRALGRLGVVVLWPQPEEAVPLLLERLERLRSQQRGVR
jgi:uncharacterized protein (DUF58 family)